MSINDDTEFLVHLRGLPYSVEEDGIREFFEMCSIPEGGVDILLNRDGNSSGEAFVRFDSKTDLDIASSKHKDMLGHRYIEVYKSNAGHKEEIQRRRGAYMARFEQDGVVKLRGLPFHCTKEEISFFFQGLDIVPNGITLLDDMRGRPSGESFVQFISSEVAEKAVRKNKEKIGHRYIEIFRSSIDERNNSIGPDPHAGFYDSRFSRKPDYDSRGYSSYRSFNDGYAPYGRYKSRDYDNRYDSYRERCDYNRPVGPIRNNFRMERRESRMERGRGKNEIAISFHSQTGHSIHMRGLPFSVDEREIHEFFSPLQPTTVQLERNFDGRLSGEADVDFASHEDVQEAMKKNRDYIKNRYVELFLRSTPDTEREVEPPPSNSTESVEDYQEGTSYSVHSMGNEGTYNSSGSYTPDAAYDNVENNSFVQDYGGDDQLYNSATNQSFEQTWS